MKNFLIRIASACCFSILIIGTGCSKQSEDAPVTNVSLRFAAQVDGQPLVIGGQRYPSATGLGAFTVEDFKMYISNIALKNTATGDVYLEEDSYHLLRFANATATFEIVLAGVEVSDYDTIEMAIGVDPIRNLSIQSLGDLNPNNQMAWNWDVGYKFLLLEGMFYPENDAPPIPLVYHVGFSENYKELSFSLKNNSRSIDRSTSAIDFEIDILEMFQNPKTIDFNVLPSVKFDKKEAKMFADNYADMIRIGLTTTDSQR